MKKIALLLFALFSLIGYSQTSNYTITSFLAEGVQAPNTHHLGQAWLNALVQADEQIPYNITQATFSANSTLDWHKHTTPQVLIVIEGQGYYQERGKDPVLMKKGDVVTCNRDTEHWHTASADQKVSYLAIYGNEPTIWTEKLTREYYETVAQQLKQP